MSNREIIHFNGRFLGMKQQGRWEYCFRTNASGVVALVPVTDAGELILVEQYRVPVQSIVLELPAGLAGDDGHGDEDLKTAANRELVEETGYQASWLKKILVGPSSSGLTDEVLHIYYAGGLKKVGPGGGENNENIEVHLMPLDNAEAWLAKKSNEGIMIDPKIFAGLYWASLYKTQTLRTSDLE